MPRHRLTAALPLLLALLVGTLPCFGSVALDLREIAPGVHVHQGVHELPDHRNRGEIANIGFIEGRRCVAVIDTGGSPEQGRALRDAIRATTRTPICYVVNTHVHPDHIYGNRAFREPGIHFIGHYKLAAAMAARAEFYRDKAHRDLGFALTAEDFVLPDTEVKGQLELDLGERRLTLTAHRSAHTDNDLTVYDHATETLWLSDLLFMDHLPVIDGSLNGWLEVLERLTQLPARRAVPGHGPVAAFWPSDALPQLQYLGQLQTELRNAIRQGWTIERAIASVGRSARNRWALFDEFHPRNVATGFAELEWEED
ncbi:MAG: quinoprotein relay system zinc metallohydrolase 2 [Gammaproteobacteria bacterium]|nr:quinoprotein relay system zinc metallohydrolase 2 [Gammaproteobacteria bacterium]